MSKKSKSKSKSKPSVKVHHPPASDSSLTKSNMSFSSTPYTTANAQPVQPLTTPKLRQLAPGPNVRIIGKDGI